MYQDIAGNAITATGIHSITLTPQHDRSLPESITLNAGIGGGGQLGSGTVIPIEKVLQITVSLAGTVDDDDDDEEGGGGEP